MRRFLSVCSGIEAASVALYGLGWTAIGFAEIDKAAARLLSARYGSNMPGEPLSKNGVPNHGDFTAIDPKTLGQVDWLIGGTPCQAFSIAGKRQSLADARGNLSLAYVVLAHELARSNGLRGALWENVPGVLNTHDNAFGCFLAALVGHDSPFAKPKWRGWPRAGMADGPRGRLAWRVLDAQHFGLAQRRARVFVVASFGDGPDPAQILFEPQGVRGDSPKGRKAREGIAADIAPSLVASGRGVERTGDTRGQDPVIAVLAHGQGGAEIGIDQSPTLNCNHEQPILIAPPLTSNPYGDHEAREGLLVAHSLRGEGFDASEDGTGRGTPIVPVVYRTSGNTGAYETGDRTDALSTGTDRTAHVLAFQDRFRGDDGRGYDRPPPASEELTGALETVKPWNVAVEEPYTLAIRGRGDSHDLEFRQDGTANALLTPNGGRAGIGVGAIATQWAVRRLTPRECERLQGFPDDYTAIPGAADGPRYRQLGNSFAVNVIFWLGQRINSAQQGSI